MNRQAWLVLVLVPLLAPGSAGAGERCACRFEVSAASGTIRPVRRATRTAEKRTCTFDVRLRVASQDAGACDGASALLRGVGGAAMRVDPWAMPWERVTVRARKHGVRRRVLRARVQGTDGAVGRARLALRCEAEPVLAGCDDVLAESSYCYLGGGSRPRVVGLTSGMLCGGGDDEPPLAALQKPSLAVWQGDAWTCGGGSPMGGFVAIPLEGGEPRRVAGPCAATATDGDALLVLPRAGFDDPLPARPAGAGPDPVVLVGPMPFPHDPPHERQIRAYDLRDDVPGGAYRVAFDLNAIPEGSPCGAMIFDAIAAQDGIVYAAGCRPTFFGNCAREPFICVFDTNTGAMRPRLFLEDFAGNIRGLATLPGGRLVVLTDDPTQLPPIGYVDPGVVGTVGTDQLHLFDVSDGSRLDSKTLTTAGAQGLACAGH